MGEKGITRRGFFRILGAVAATAAAPKLLARAKKEELVVHEVKQLKLQNPPASEFAALADVIADHIFETMQRPGFCDRLWGTAV